MKKEKPNIERHDMNEQQVKTMIQAARREDAEVRADLLYKESNAKAVSAARLKDSGSIERCVKKALLVRDALLFQSLARIEQQIIDAMPRIPSNGEAKRVARQKEQLDQIGGG
jgi:hypothetical protein